jgi:hypothetical protein
MYLFILAVFGLASFSCKRQGPGSDAAVSRAEGQPEARILDVALDPNTLQHNFYSCSPDGSEMLAKSFPDANPVGTQPELEDESARNGKKPKNSAPSYPIGTPLDEQMQRALKGMDCRVDSIGDLATIKFFFDDLAGKKILTASSDQKPASESIRQFAQFVRILVPTEKVVPKAADKSVVGRIKGMWNSEEIKESRTSVEGRVAHLLGYSPDSAIVDTLEPLVSAVVKELEGISNLPLDKISERRELLKKNAFFQDYQNFLTIWRKASLANGKFIRKNPDDCLIKFNEEISGLNWQSFYLTCFATGRIASISKKFIVGGTVAPFSNDFFLFLNEDERAYPWNTMTNFGREDSGRFSKSGKEGVPWRTCRISPPYSNNGTTWYCLLGVESTDGFLKPGECYSARYEDVPEKMVDGELEKKIDGLTELQNAIESNNFNTICERIIK